MSIYIDYCNCIYDNNFAFHGGARYAKKIIRDIVKKRKGECTVFWKKGYQAKDDADNEIRNGSRIILCEDIEEEIDYLVDGIVFFIPLLRTKHYHYLKEIKHRYPNITLSVIIHGTRILDDKPDKYNKYYRKRYFYAGEILKYTIKASMFKHVFCKYIKYIDRVFTGSNDALQKIIALKRVRYIAISYDGCTIEKRKVVNQFSEKYILFLSAHAEVKNFARALEAFCKYKKNNCNQIYLYVTGIDDIELKKFSSNSKVDKTIANKWVKCFGFVEEQKLCDLLDQCMYLLYPSKSEGFGLPILEAAIYNKKSLASYVSSTPEVLGSLASYVDPYSVEAICEGMSNMENDYLTDELFEDKVKALLTIARIDTEYLIKRITE